MTKQEIAEKLKKLTSEGVKISKIEKETKFTKNGLSAVIGGHKLLPEKWIPVFEKYLNGGVKSKPQPKEKPKTAIAMAELIKYCNQNGVNFDDLPNHIEKLTLERDAAISSLNALKLKVEKKGWVKTDRPLKLGNSDFSPSKFMEERRNLKNGVKIKTEKKETAD